jgi:hypothetical protein
VFVARLEPRLGGGDVGLSVADDRGDDGARGERGLGERAARGEGARCDGGFDDVDARLAQPQQGNGVRDTGRLLHGQVRTGLRRNGEQRPLGDVARLAASVPRRPYGDFHTRRHTLARRGHSERLVSRTGTFGPARGPTGISLPSAGGVRVE